MTTRLVCRSAIHWIASGVAAESSADRFLSGVRMSPPQDQMWRHEAPLGIMGDPCVASAAKGERLFGVLQQRLVQTCRELHAQPLRRYRQFGSHCP